MFGECRCIPRRPAQEWICCDAWSAEEGVSMERSNSCPVELSGPEGYQKEANTQVEKQLI